MTGVSVTINTKAVDQMLSGLTGFANNPYAFLDEVGGQLVSSTQDRFDTSATPDGVPWTPSQRALNEGGKTLKKDAHLVGSITHDPTGHHVDVGSDLDYAAIHQLGGKAGRNKATTIEARAYLGISPEDEQMIEATAYDFIRAAAK